MAVHWVDFSITVERSGEGHGFILRAYNGLPPFGEHQPEPCAGPVPRPWPVVGREATDPVSRVVTDWLFPAEVRTELARQIRAMAGDHQSRLRLRVAMPPNVLAAWFRDRDCGKFVWELLRGDGLVPKEDGRLPRLDCPFLAVDGFVSVVRQELGRAVSPTPVATGPLRVLIVHANSIPDLTIERLEEMLARVRRVLDPYERKQLVECAVLKNATPEQVETRVADPSTQPHILITLCHGEAPQHGPLDGKLILCDGRGGQADLTASELAAALRSRTEEPCLRLALMPHCQTIAAAPALIAAGVPAVVGMQRNLCDELATADLAELLVAELFRSLRQHESRDEGSARLKSIDQCLIDVRQAIYRKWPNTDYWWIPTLWLNSTDGHLFASRREIERSLYLRQVREECGRLIVVGRVNVSVPLETLYVDAGTRQRVRKLRQRPDREAAAADGAPPGRDDGAIPDRLRALETTYEEIVLEDVDVVARLTQPPEGPNAPPRRFHVWGPPGAGKSTLSRWLGEDFAARAQRGEGPVPVVVRLHAFADWLLAHRGDPKALRSYLADRVPVTPGDLILLLDGLDEVLEECPGATGPFLLRQAVGEAIRTFLDDYSKVPVVLTSRQPEPPASLPGFTAVELKPFDDPRILAYAERSFRSFPPTYEGASPDPAAEARKFADALRQNPSLRDLAGTPLLLSLVVLLYGREGLPLPAGQTRLLDRATEELLASAVAGRSARTHTPELRRRVLQAIAFATTVRNERLPTFPRVEFERQARVVLNAGVSSHEFEPTSLDAVFDDLTANTGLLQRLPEGTFTFLHASFQDYFAAGALVAPATHQTRSLPAEACREFLDRKAWDPNRESLVLFLAGLSPDPGPLLDLLADAARDDWFRHRLALAARCLAEISPARRRACQERIDAVTTTTFDLWSGHRGQGTREAVSHLTRALPALAMANGMVKGKPLLDLLARLLAEPNRDVRGEAVEAVRALGASAATPAILDHLARLLADPNNGVRGEAVEAVGGVGASAATPAILDLLAQCLADPDEYVRGAAAEAVGGVGATAATPAILDLLAQCLADPNSRMQLRALRAVGAMGASAATPAILDLLAQLLADSSKYVRHEALETMKALGAAAPTILARLARLLADPNRGVLYEDVAEVRAGVAEVRAGVAEAAPAFLDILAQRLAEPSWEVRDTALRVVSAMGASAATPAFLDHLARLLAEPDFGVRYAALRAVGAMGASAATPAFLDHLARLFADPDWSARWTAAGVLGKFAQAGIRLFRDAESGETTSSSQVHVRTVAELSRWDVPGRPTGEAGLFGS